MGKHLGRLGGHLGHAMGKLGNGKLTEAQDPADIVAFVAACSRAGTPHWYGPNEFPPTEEGERAAVDEWEHLHARHLVTSPMQAAIARFVTEMSNRLSTSALESPVVVLHELHCMHDRTESLLASTVMHARALGVSWAVIAEALEATELEVRRRFDGS